MLSKNASQIKNGSSVGPNAGKTSVEVIVEGIDKYIDSMNARAPMAIDDRTIFLKAARNGKIQTYYYRLNIDVNAVSQQALIEPFQSAIEKNLCEDVAKNALIAAGFEYVYSYADSNKLFITNASVNKKTCESYLYHKLSGR